jgi:hypothetical protein
MTFVTAIPRPASGLANTNRGNVAFRKMMKERRVEYLAVAKEERRTIVSELISAWKAQDPNGRFVVPRYDGGYLVYYEAPEEKVDQFIRRYLHRSEVKELSSTSWELSAPPVWTKVLNERRTGPAATARDRNESDKRSRGGGQAERQTPGGIVEVLSNDGDGSSKRLSNVDHELVIPFVTDDDDGLLLRSAAEKSHLDTEEELSSIYFPERLVCEQEDGFLAVSLAQLDASRQVRRRTTARLVSAIDRPMVEASQPLYRFLCLF